jgi:hypothetical protein
VLISSRCVATRVVLAPLAPPPTTPPRLLRLLRVLKLLKAFPELQVLVIALLKSFASIGWISLLLGLVLAVTFFSKPNCNAKLQCNFSFLYS